MAYECSPILTLEALLDWSPPPENEDWSRLVKPKVEKPEKCFQWSESEFPVLKNKSEVPKTLFCHDMKGGYLEDKFVEGCLSDEAFTFFRWSGIDIFVYFSHSFITIPPLGWINAAHTNGVTVLGTIITEGDSGKALFKKLLQDETLIEKFCRKSAQIAHHYKLSGFLLNVENKIKAKSMNRFKKTVKTLREELKKRDPQNILIWYDSVINNGKVKYQNELNKNNSDFFDMTDGIFLNYNWDEKKLSSSHEFAGNRRFDVFVGVDVFGRGCFGGGGFNSNLAMKEIRKHNLSAAIFAPGWVFECASDDETFNHRDYQFWNSIYPHLFISALSKLPFKTSFCIGLGKNYFKKGQMSKEGPWYNLSQQDHQISNILPWKDNECSIGFNSSDAYNGGNCLVLKNNDFSRLLLCDIHLKKEEKLKINLTIKSQSSESGEIEVRLKYLDDGSAKKTIVLQHSDACDKVNNWRKRTFIFGPCEAIILEMSCRVDMPGSELLLGKIHLSKI